MSYYIATGLKIKDNNITVKAGCNNVKPFYSTAFEYESIDEFMFDVLSGGLQIDNLNTKTANKVKEAIKDVKDLHKSAYGNLQERYMYGWININPFSLYMIGNVYFSNKRGQKEKFLENSADIKHTSEQHKTGKLVEHAIYKGNWDEYVSFYSLLLTFFTIKINN